MKARTISILLLILLLMPVIPLTSAYSEDINRLKMQTTTSGDVCNGCDSCVYGCCWDSFPVKCNELTSETSSEENTRIQNLRNQKMEEMKKNTMSK